MDEKTEDLRDIFMEVSDTETVTESQAEQRGTLADADADEVGREVGEVVAELRERYAFETDLSRAEYVEVVRAVHDGDDDATIAADLGLDADTVFRARMDLHLLREGDTNAPFDLSVLRESGASVPDDLGVDDETFDRYRRALDARDEARAANHRYRAAFEAALTDVALEGGYTDAVQEDGLREAAEDIETDVSF